MFKFEQINSLFNCQLCNQFFQDPVTLPCGETVCKSHCDRISNDKCLFCSEIHITPKNGFLVNKVIKAQLEFQFNKINLNFTQFNDYKKILENLNKDLKEFETIHNDPCSYIYEYFSEITRQVDLRKEIVIKDIHDYSDALLQTIDELKEDCLEKLKTKTNVEKNTEEIKNQISCLNIMFDSLEIDDKKLKEIMSKKESSKVQKIIEPLLDRYKFELQGNKHHKLAINSINYDNVFGILTAFDYDKVDSKIVSSITQERSLLYLTGFESNSFSLLWRGSRDGFAASTFHKLCDGKPNTLTLIKSTTGSVLGGYTSVPWSCGGCYKADNTAFLFTLTNPSSVPLKIKVTNIENAVYHQSNYGPTFGTGHDLCVYDSSNNNTNSIMKFNSYDFPNGKIGEEGGKFFLGDSNKFQSAEIEVFQVIL